MNLVRAEELTADYLKHDLPALQSWEYWANSSEDRQVVNVFDANSLRPIKEVMGLNQAVEASGSQGYAAFTPAKCRNPDIFPSGWHILRRLRQSDPGVQRRGVTRREA